MTQRKMILGLHLGTGYGSQAMAWRAPGVDPANYTDINAQIRYAQKAERGKFAFLFLPDSPSMSRNMDREAPQANLDPMITLAVLAHATDRIGFVATGSTTFNAPFNIARQFKALDVLSHGRIGWNAVTTSDPLAAANFGETVADRPERYQRAHETIQIVQSLWGSWQQDAWVKDPDTGVFADTDKIQPINLRGEHVASRGPLPIPPSEQGQPVIFSAGGGEYGLGIAGRYAGGVIGAAFSIEDARAQREAVRDAARQAGRDPDEVKYFAGVMPALGTSVRDAVDKRIALGRDHLADKVQHLGGMLGVPLDRTQLHEPLTDQQLASARPSPFDPRSQHALTIARQGWTLEEILAHGVIDYHPAPIGSAEAIADHLQEWFEAGAADGFWVSLDVNETDIDTFVDEVMPILREHGLLDDHYQGATLRDHLGVPRQYGTDARLS